MTLALIARFRAKKYEIIPPSLVAQWKGCLTLLYLGELSPLSLSHDPLLDSCL